MIVVNFNFMFNPAYRAGYYFAVFIPYFAEVFPATNYLNANKGAVISLINPVARACLLIFHVIIPLWVTLLFLRHNQMNSCLSRMLK